jgi:hypothetical protein
MVVVRRLRLRRGAGLAPLAAAIRANRMRQLLRPGFVLLALIAALPARAESSKDDWFSEDCAEKKQQRWCAPWLRQGGWKLKYQTKSPEDQTEVFWLIEVWIKGGDALVCELKGSKNGPARSNGCYSLSEVK